MTSKIPRPTSSFAQPTVDDQYPGPGAEHLPDLTSRYLAAILAGDRHAALRVVIDDGLTRGIPIPDVYLQVLQPAQAELGRLWQENRITVAQEHLGTAITQLVIAQLYPHLPRRVANGKVVLFGCVAGELHDVGARIAADFFEIAGYDVRFLGANVPTESLIAMVGQLQPDVLAMSVSLPAHLPTLRDLVEQVRALAAPQPVVVVGGTVVRWLPNLASQMEHELVGADIAELIDAVNRHLGVAGDP